MAETLHLGFVVDESKAAGLNPDSSEAVKHYTALLKELRADLAESQGKTLNELHSTPTPVDVESSGADVLPQQG